MKSQAALHSKIAEDLRRNKSQHSRSRSRKSEKQNNVYSTQSDSPQGSQDDINKDASANLDNRAYYRCLSPSHDQVKLAHDPIFSPEFHSLNPILPHEVEGIIDCRTRSIETNPQNPKKVVTTLDRSMKYSPEMPYKRAATSPLKSCIQNAEVKVARGGVAISFDPWKSSKKPILKVNLYFYLYFRENRIRKRMKKSIYMNIYAIMKKLGLQMVILTIAKLNLLE